MFQINKIAKKYYKNTNSVLTGFKIKFIFGFEYSEEKISAERRGNKWWNKKIFKKTVKWNKQIVAIIPINSKEYLRIKRKNDERYRESSGTALFSNGNWIE